MKIDYRGFKYWLVETTVRRQKIWRIEYPDGQKSETFEKGSEAGVRQEIDLTLLDSSYFEASGLPVALEP